MIGTILAKKAVHSGFMNLNKGRHGGACLQNFAEMLREKRESRV